jgi:hypothetical protein
LEYFARGTYHNTARGFKTGGGVSFSNDPPVMNPQAISDEKAVRNRSRCATQAAPH